MQSNNKMNHICQQFSNNIQELFNDSISIILFGSAATEEYQIKKSDLNFLVVLGEKGIKQLEVVQKSIKRWRKQRISLPLFVTKSYIQESLDSFPIEFLNMQSAYQVIHGEDVLKYLKIDKNDIRLQCEKELKGKLLQLRQGFILTNGQSSALRSLISQSIVAFVSIFKALLFLQDKTIPKKKIDVLLAACDAFDEIDRSLFETLLMIRSGKHKKSKLELSVLVKQYIQSIENLSEAVDKM